MVGSECRSTCSAEEKHSPDFRSQELICGSGTRFGYSMDTELRGQKQDCTRYDVKFPAILASGEQAWSGLH